MDDYTGITKFDALELNSVDERNVCKDFCTEIQEIIPSGQE